MGGKVEEKRKESMTKAKRIILIVALCFLAAVSVTAAGIFAYFSSSSSSDKGLTTNITGNDYIVSVSTFDQLYLVSQSEYYNDKNIASTTRKVIRLADNIEGGKLTLPADLRITADVHIDLNGKTLDLNGHTLTLQHAYAGSFLLYNGTMSANNGQLVIDTPNAVTEFDGVKDSADQLIDLNAADSYVKIISQEFEYSAYAALYTVGEALSTDLEKRPARLTYAEFNAPTGNYEPSVFLATKTHDDTTEACAYVAVGHDLILPTHYLATGYTVTYSSDDPSILSNAGNALAVGNAILTATVSDGVEGSTNSVSVTFTVHVVAPGTTSIAEPLIKSYLADYYKEGEIKVGTAKHNGYYLFSNGIELPMRDVDLGLTLNYEPLDDNKQVVTTTSAPENGVYLFEPNDQCAFLRVSLNENSASFNLPVYSNYVANEETAARLIINRLYGGAIVYDSTKTHTQLYTIDDIKANADLADLAPYVTDYNITGITYAIKAETDALGFYEITDRGLERKEGAEIPPEKVGFITCTFTFGEGGTATTTTLDIDLYVLYVTGNEGTVSSFLPYYNIYDKTVSGQSVSATIEMPFAYDKGLPYSMYEFALADNYTLVTDQSDTSYYQLKGADTPAFSAPAAISLVLKYDDGASTPFSYSETGTLSEQFNAWLKANSLTLADLASKNAVWEITVTPENSIFEDSKILLIYKYTFASNTAGKDPSWATYQGTIEGTDGSPLQVYTPSTVSEFTLKGGVFYSASSTSENAVKNQALFAWMQENCNATGEALIVNDALAIPKELDVTKDTQLQSVTDWSGIKYLTGVTTVNLDGVNFSSTRLSDRLGDMQELQSLSLQNCGITAISELTLKKLRTLNIANNTIADFSWLTSENFPELQRVYVYGNDNYTDGYRGSTGMSNYQTFEDLVRVGVTVYNTLNANNVPMPFAESTELNDYRRLKSIVYQSVLKAGVSITNVYSKYTSLTPNDFKLSKNYQNMDSANGITWNFGGGTNANDATWFSVTVTTTSGISLTVKFYVDRK